jgi:hypothetical protein
MENDENNLKLLEEIKFKNFKISEYEKEIQNHQKIQEEFIKFIKNKDDVIPESLQNIIDLYDNITSKKNQDIDDYQIIDNNKDDVIVENLNEGGNNDESSKKFMRKPAFFKRGGYKKAQLLGKNIFLTISQQIDGVLDEKLFTPYQKEILSYYNGHCKNLNFQNYGAKRKSEIFNNQILKRDLTDQDEGEDFNENKTFENFQTTDKEDFDPTKINWQYVMVFKNPDSEDSLSKMDFLSAKKLYDRCFYSDRRMKNNTSWIQEKLVFDYILKKLKLDISPLSNEANPNNSPEALDKAIYNKAEYYKFNKGGSMRKIKSEAGFNQWITNNQPPNDILTVIRNICIYKITRVLNLRTFSLLSETGEYIYLLIHAEDDVLKYWAKHMEYKLQFEVGVTDLISLEPCDSKMRPYRFIKYEKPIEVSDLEKELENLYKFLYGDEMLLLQNQVIYENSHISSEDWSLYKMFLKYLKSKENKLIENSEKVAELKGVMIRELFMEAIECVNLNSKIQLKNMWNYFGCSPVGAYKDYFNEIIGESNTSDSLWRRYVNMEGKISLFKDLDRIKMLDDMLFSQLRLDKMKKNNVLEKYFPLHIYDTNESCHNLTVKKLDAKSTELKREDNYKINESPVESSFIKKEKEINKGEVQIELKQQQKNNSFSELNVSEENSNIQNRIKIFENKGFGKLKQNIEMEGLKNQNIIMDSVNQNKLNNDLIESYLMNPYAIIKIENDQNPDNNLEKQGQSVNLGDTLGKKEEYSHIKLKDESQVFSNLMRKNIPPISETIKDFSIENQLHDQKPSDKNFKFLCPKLKITENQKIAGLPKIDLTNIEKYNNIQYTQIEEPVESFIKQKEVTFNYIKNNWKFTFLGKVPSDAIREYFGEKVALYYEFLSFYNIYLFILGVFGIVAYIVQNTDNYQSKSIEYFYSLGFHKSKIVIFVNTFYSFLIIIWSSIFLKHWKIRQEKFAVKWGQLKLNEKEETLPSFVGNKRRSPVDDNLNESYMPFLIKILKRLIAYLVSIVIIVIVIIIVLYLLYFRNWLVVNKIWGPYNRAIINIPTVINVIQITIFNLIYDRVAYFMNDFENHKTYISYESSLASKIFLFQFVNCFNSLFIVSFIKKYIDFFGGCVKNSMFGKEVSQFTFCDQELENQMVTTTIINVLKNAIELLIPWIKNKCNRIKKDRIKLKRIKTLKEGSDTRTKILNQRKSIFINNITKLQQNLDFQFDLNDFDVNYVDGTFEEYLELVIQFGYVTLFAMSFSLLPIIYFLSNIIEMQVDKTKLLKFYKRPVPTGVNSIGNWFYIFEILSFIAIFTNLAIIIFTSNNYYELNSYYKVILYMCLVFFYIVTKILFARFMPDEANSTVELKNRQQYVIEKNCEENLTDNHIKKNYKVDLDIYC